MTPSYGLGLLFIFAVTLIWSVASVVVQFLYTSQHFDSPFLLTYIGTSLFIIFLPTRKLWASAIIPWRASANGEVYQNVPSVQETEPIFTIDDDDHENDSLEDAMSTTTTTAITSIPPKQLLSHEEHFRIALKIAPVWFFANWSYNASLAYTSITSSTILASTGSLFTFMFAVVSGDESFTCATFLGVVLGVSGSILTGLSDINGGGGGGDDDGTTRQLEDLFQNGTAAAVVAATAGHLGTPHHILPNSGGAGHAVFGDTLGLLSAIGYGAYTVMIRVYCPRDEDSFSMQLLLGYIGLVNALSLLPVAVWVLVLDENSHTAEHLTWIIFGYLCAKGMLDNVLSDYLWARAVVLTSATVATVGLGLTIPLAFFSDWAMGHANVANVQSICGALAVLCGFVLVNLGEQQQEENQQPETTTNYNGVIRAEMPVRDTELT